MCDVRVCFRHGQVRTGSLSGDVWNAEGVTSSGEAVTLVETATEAAVRRARSVSDQLRSTKVRKYLLSQLFAGRFRVTRRSLRSTERDFVVRRTVLDNRRHLRSKHSDCVDRPRQFFERLSTAFAFWQRLLRQYPR